MKLKIYASIFVVLLTSSIPLNGMDSAQAKSDQVRKAYEKINTAIINQIVSASKTSDEAAATYKSLYCVNRSFKNLVVTQLPTFITPFADKFADRSELDAAKLIHAKWARTWRDSIWNNVGDREETVGFKRRMVKQCIWRKSSLQRDCVRHVELEAGIELLKIREEYLQDYRIMIWALRRMASHMRGFPQEQVQALADAQVTAVTKPKIVAWVAKAQKEKELNQAVSSDDTVKALEYLKAGVNPNNSLSSLQPLGYAIWNGNHEMRALLLQYGAIMTEGDKRLLAHCGE